MSVSVGYDASSLVALVKELESRGGNVGDAMRAVSELVVSSVQDVFERQGPGWPPLAPATIARRRGGGGAAKMLVDSGNLAGSITRAWNAREAEAYTDVPYAGFHVTGTSRMPARDFTAVDIDELLEEAAGLLLGSLLTS